MVLVDRGRVQSAFDGASDYARNATVQRRIATDLAERLVGLDLPDDLSVLEIGCGTGFLTRELLERGLPGQWLITDKAPNMVRRCREQIGATPNRHFSVLDGEYGMAGHPGRYDLICASMAMQWFDDLESAVQRLIEALNPGGHLVFNTLAAGTFHEWHHAHRELGLAAGAAGFPTVASLRDRLARQELRSFEVERHVETHENARDFVSRLKLIGAGTARKDHRPLPPRAMRRVMARFDELGARATYEVVTCHFIRDSAR